MIRLSGGLSTRLVVQKHNKLSNGRDPAVKRIPLAAIHRTAGSVGDSLSDIIDILAVDAKITPEPVLGAHRESVGEFFVIARMIHVSSPRRVNERANWQMPSPLR